MTFARLRVEGEHGMILWGSPDSVLEDVVLDDVRVRVRRLARDPKLLLFERDLPALLALHTERLTVRGPSVEWAEDAVVCESRAARQPVLPPSFAGLPR